MKPGEFIFVKYSKGEFQAEDTKKDIKYNNVHLSNGIEKMAIRNASGRTDFSDFIPEKSIVKCEFTIRPYKEKPQVDLAKIELVK